ncbi:MAG: hypothetical protein JWO41_348 [Candidatus Saccharibacteria bacterium]|nr:hypothetical protein [Candidatus Saccharibacteria bacterium]
MNLFSKFKTSKKTDVSQEFVYDEAVIITLHLEDVTSEDEIKKVEQLEAQIKELLPDGSGVDGHEFGDNDCIVYIYGPSADKVWEKIEPALKKSDFNHPEIELQYGLPDDPKTKSKKFSM